MENQPPDNGTPYMRFAGEVVADILALVQAVEAWRPSAPAVPGTYRVTMNMAQGTLTVGKIQEDGTVTLIEQVDVNPTHTETFGASILPVDLGPAH